MQASIFFTFYGLNIVHRDFDKRLKVSPVGNPALPMPVPMADIFTSLPGMKGMATGMMKSMFKSHGVACPVQQFGRLGKVAATGACRVWGTKTHPRSRRFCPRVLSKESAQPGGHLHVADGIHGGTGLISGRRLARWRKKKTCKRCRKTVSIVKKSVTTMLAAWAARKRRQLGEGGIRERRK